MRNNIVRIAAVAAFALVVAACGGDGNDDTTTTAAAAEDTTTTTTTAAPATTAAPEGNTVADVAAADENFSTLLAAVEAAGLTDSLADPDATLTVFAPTNAAFEDALDSLGITAEDLLADTETLTAILTYHVLSDVVTSGDLAAAGTEEVTATTLGGEDLTIIIGDAGNVGFRDQDAAVVQADVEASNGVIHAIDGVLLPPSIAG